MNYNVRREREKRKIRDHILQAALNIASADGWHSVTIRKIADAVEYAPPIIYEYFENKEALLNELVLLGHRRLYSNFELAKKEESDPKKLLMLLSLIHWEFAFQYNDLYKLMFSFERNFPKDEVHSIVRKIQKLFLELTDNERLAEELMFSWICLLNGLIYNIIKMELPPELRNIEPKELYCNAIERFVNNI